MIEEGDPRGAEHHEHECQVQDEGRLAVPGAEVGIEAESDETRYDRDDVGGSELTPTGIFRTVEVSGQVSQARTQGPEGGADQGQDLKPSGRLSHQIGRQSPSRRRCASAVPRGFSLPLADQLGFWHTLILALTLRFAKGPLSRPG